MYGIGDLIVYGRTGVCRVEEIHEEEARGAEGGETPRQYYTLRPLYQKCSIRTPVTGGKVYSRPIISRAEAKRLIERMPEVDAEPYHNRNLNQLREHYRERLERFDCEALISLMKSLHLKKKEAETQKRKFGAVDERFMREAEDLLYGEFAAALDIDRDKVENYIAKSLKKD